MRTATRAMEKPVSPEGKNRKRASQRNRLSGSSSPSRLKILPVDKRLGEAKGRLEAETQRSRFFTLCRDLLGITDFQGCFREVNPSWEKCLGYTAEELRTK